MPFANLTHMWCQHDIWLTIQDRVDKAEVRSVLPYASKKMPGEERKYAKKVRAWSFLRKHGERLDAVTHVDIEPLTSGGRIWTEYE